MKIAEINMVDYGSTGNIMFQIADCALKNGYEVKSFSKKWKKQSLKREYHFFYGTTLENGIHVILSKLIGFQGLFSYFGTKQLIRELDKFKPDIIHLHNLHDSSTCLPILFKYVKKKNIPVIWTLHDCWTMTGQCPHFSMIKCDKWKNGCFKCPQLHNLLKNFIDCSRYMWNKKKEWFSGIENITIVTPSRWLAQIVKESYLKKYSVKIINNGIDTTIFSPRKSDFKEKNKIKDKYIVLGVAFGWGEKKGLDVFQKLSKRLNEKYVIVMVGTNETIDKTLSEKIISIHCTQNQKEIAEIYSTADVFVNPTREDTFPTTNIEALACGTPVITYKTGGSPEILNEQCGVVVEVDDIDNLEKNIINICENKIYSEKECIKRASQFNKEEKFKEYIKLYKEIYKKEKY